VFVWQLQGAVMNKPAYDFTSATFFFFKTLGRKPGGVLSIALWQLIFLTLVSSLILWAVWPLLNAIFEAVGTGAEPDPAEILRMLGGVWLAVTAGVVGTIMIALMAQGAWLRLLTRDEVKPGLPFRFGGDEWRLLVVNLVFIAMNVVAVLLVSVLFMAMNVSLSGMEGFGGVMTRALANTALFVVIAVVWIILMIRFAAAPAMTVLDRRVRLFEAFAASKGVAGWMFLSYLVLIVVILVGAMVFGGMQQVIIMIGAADAMAALMTVVAQPGMSEEAVLAMMIEAFSSSNALIALAIVMVLQIIFQIFYEVIWHGVGAYVAGRHGASPLAMPENFTTAPDSTGVAPTQG